MSVLLFMIGAYVIGFAHANLARFRERWWLDAACGLAVAVLTLCSMAVSARAQAIDGDTIRRAWGRVHSSMAVQEREAMTCKTRGDCRTLPRM